MSSRAFGSAALCFLAALLTGCFDYDGALQGFCERTGDCAEDELGVCVPLGAECTEQSRCCGELSCSNGACRRTQRPSLTIAVNTTQLGSAPVGEASTVGGFVEHLGGERTLVLELGVDPQGGPFHVDIDGCSGRLLEAGELCLFSIQFAPLEAGVFEGTIRVQEPASAILPTQASITIQGTGAAN